MIDKTLTPRRTLRHAVNTTSAFAISLSLALSPMAAMAGPTGGDVTAGSASISQSGTSTVIDQASQRAVIDWQSFDVSVDESVHFDQAYGASAATLNRVLAGQESVISGSITAPGQVVLYNSQGVMFTDGAQIDVGGLVATSIAPDADRFMGDGSLVMDQRFNDRVNPDARVSNAGSIDVGAAGLAALVGPHVENSGHINARLGTASLVSGEAVTLDMYGDDLVNIAVTDPAMAGSLSNTGTIAADGGQVVISAAAASGVVDQAVNVGGVVRAQTVEQSQGRIVLAGANTDVNITGQIDASGGAGETGGSVIATGDAVTLSGSASIDASGGAGGGQVAIGGGYRGGPAPSGGVSVTRSGEQLAIALSRGMGAISQFEAAGDVHVAAGALIDASATGDGDGGNVFIWSDGTTTMNGAIEAFGAALGQGGFVETSGASLGVGASASVDTGGGTWLLDPDELIVGPGSDTATTTYVDAGTIASDLDNNDVVLSATDLIRINEAIVNEDPAGTYGLFFSATDSEGIIEVADSISINGDVYMSAPGSIRILNNGTFIDSGDGTVWLDGGTTGWIWQAAGTAVLGAEVVAIGSRVTLDSGLNYAGLLAGEVTSTGAPLVEGYYGGDSADYRLTAVGEDEDGNPVMRLRNTTDEGLEVTLNQMDGDQSFTRTVWVDANSQVFVPVTGTGTYAMFAAGEELDGPTRKHTGGTGVRDLDTLFAFHQANATGTTQIAGVDGPAIDDPSGNRGPISDVTINESVLVAYRAVIGQSGTQEVVLAGSGSCGPLDWVVCNPDWTRSVPGNNEYNRLVFSALPYIPADDAELLLGRGSGNGNGPAIRLVRDPGGRIVAYEYNTGQGQGGWQTISLDSLDGIATDGSGDSSDFFVGSIALTDGPQNNVTIYGPDTPSDDPNFEVIAGLGSENGSIVVNGNRWGIDGFDPQPQVPDQIRFDVFGDGTQNDPYRGDSERLIVDLDAPSNDGLWGQNNNQRAVIELTNLIANERGFYEVALIEGYRDTSTRYSESPNDPRFDISASQATATVNVGDQTRTYGDTVLSPVGDLYTVSLSPDDLIGGLNNQIDGTFSIVDEPSDGIDIDDPTLDVDTYAEAIGGTGLSANRYAITYENGDLIVTPRDLVVAADDASRVYGDANPTFTASASDGAGPFTEVTGLTNGDSLDDFTGTISLSTAATTTSNVGDYTIDADGNLANQNYNVVYQDGTLTITRRDLTVTADSYNLTYGDQAPAYSSTGSGLVNGDTLVGLGLPNDYTVEGGWQTGDVPDAGDYDITPTGPAQTQNYNVAYVDGLMTVDPAQLTIQVGDRSKTQGQPIDLSTTGFQPNGLVNNDTITALDFASGGAPTTAPAGLYDITGSNPQGSFNPANYQITILDGTLTVLPLPNASALINNFEPIDIGRDPDTPGDAIYRTTRFENAYQVSPFEVGYNFEGQQAVPTGQLLAQQEQDEEEEDGQQQDGPGALGELEPAAGPVGLGDLEPAAGPGEETTESLNAFFTDYWAWQAQ